MIDKYLFLIFAFWRYWSILWVLWETITLYSWRWYTVFESLASWIIIGSGAASLPWDIFRWLWVRRYIVKLLGVLSCGSAGTVGPSCLLEIRVPGRRILCWDVDMASTRSGEAYRRLLGQFLEGRGCAERWRFAIQKECLLCTFEP